MSDRNPMAAVLPAYTRFVACRGGNLRRWWLHTTLRLTVKRMRVLDANIATLRAQQAVLDTRFARIDAEARRTAVDCAGVPAEWIEVPETRSERVLLYIHGGAFMFRFPSTHAGIIARWCRPLGARSLMVDYRLAPENPYPAALDDCHTAYRWLLEQGHDPRNIVLGGDSAGGNLALATLHRIKAAGEPMPACAVLLSPVVDFTVSGRSIIANERSDPMFAISGLLAMRALYATPERFLDPFVSPLFGDFAGFPPLLFQVGGIEVLVDESTRAAARAHAAGVPVEVEIWDKMAHVFQAFAMLPQAAEATDSVVRFIRERAGWSP
jgi:monoterpene epsilon-lactone hydrolase